MPRPALPHPRSSAVLRQVSIVLGLSCLTSAAQAQSEPATEGASDAEPIDVTVQGRAPSPASTSPRTRVSRRDFEERLPRSAPDALRYEPGVFVQQTAHGQASAFVRGRTGQQTVLLFDGIRLNTSTFRQGPNQYFFTVDSRTVHHIDVERGGASTRWGSDAIGGVLHAHPIEPRLDLTLDGPVVRPRTMIGYSSADHAFGERFQLDAQVDPSLRVLGGVGYRRVGKLTGGGAVRSPTTGGIPQVPALDEDGRTQLGTGFDEVTGDGRVVMQLGEATRLVAATYVYRQYDAPRTDQCPPPYAPASECLRYDEQFRTLAYSTLETSGGPLAKRLRFSLSFQRQHERRTNDRPASYVQNGGRDDVDTFGLSVNGETKSFSHASARTAVRYGADLYHDRVDSAAWTSFSDLPAVVPASRGLYLAGSRYTHGGVFVDPRVELGEKWEARAGARVAGARAFAPSDPESGTAGVDRGWSTVVGHAGLSYRPARALTLSGNVDRSFRAPNLDDLTSRQQAGPGFQFENASLEPEWATTLEAGASLSMARVEAEAWVFHSDVRRAITRVTRDASACPPSTPQCQASWTRFQLVNAPGGAAVQGVEFSGRVSLLQDVALLATFAATRGQTDNPQQRPSDPTVAYAERVPLSRIPPVNGTTQLRWRPRAGPYAGAGLRWALRQSQLAPSDLSDARIPEGGTPGFTVLDIFAGYRMGRQILFNVVFENVSDAAYRYHGSAVNGPGRGVIVNFESGM